ncbi:MAG: MerR family transcriptional regulator [Anaerolineae bacterium]|nr:MerR family transcriptional regulator [Gemmatimonadaceae bacterium]
MRVTAQRTGLTPHTLRAWERRYQVVAPGRSEGGQRLYSDLDIQRLSLLRRLTERGHSIARLAEVSQEDLERTAREDSGSKSPEPKPLGDDFGAKDFSAAALNATRRLDAAELHAVLERASITLGVPVFLDQVVVPTLRGIGQGWSEGTVSIAHEHLASGVIRRVLGWILRVYEITESAPRLVVATPPRQAHEMGAMLAGAAAAAEGWDVTYLGADLPIPEILASAGQVGANGVALSIVYPAIDRGLVSDLELLRGGLGSRIPLIVGGYAASQDRDRLTSIGVQVVDSLDQFRESLDDLRDRV